MKNNNFRRGWLFLTIWDTICQFVILICIGYPTDKLVFQKTNKIKKLRYSSGEWVSQLLKGTSNFQNEYFCTIKIKMNIFVL